MASWSESQGEEPRRRRRKKLEVLDKRWFWADLVGFVLFHNSERLHRACRVRRATGKGRRGCCCRRW
jgi:hypothetical protein